ncbi:hypothetical protein JHW40_23025 (plasmid) [Paracoccus alcaliphilus]|nr:hypothetical protein JHW40_23025 [Paracoccus alcaliphilus]
MRLPVIHMDDLRWQPGRYGVARDNQIVAREVAEAGNAEQWLMEGVYGWLARIVVPRATTMIWLDIPEEECIQNVRLRGIQGGGSEQAFEDLLEWVAGYRTRSNTSCFAAHLALYDAFPSSKVRLKSRDEITSYLGRLPE